MYNMWLTVIPGTKCLKFHAPGRILAYEYCALMRTITVGNLRSTCFITTLVCDMIKTCHCQAPMYTHTHPVLRTYVQCTRCEFKLDEVKGPTQRRTLSKWISCSKQNASMRRWKKPPLLSRRLPVKSSLLLTMLPLALACWSLLFAAGESGGEAGRTGRMHSMTDWGMQESTLMPVCSPWVRRPSARALAMTLFSAGRTALLASFGLHPFQHPKTTTCS